jgi:hypothetical protein
MPAILHNIAKATHCAAECGVTVSKRPRSCDDISPLGHVVPQLGKIFRWKEMEEGDLILFATEQIGNLSTAYSV